MPGCLCSATVISTRFFRNGRSSSSLRVQEAHERRHVERLLAGRALEGRQHGLAELHEAARAPGQHLPVLDCDSLLMVLLAKRPSVSMSPARSWRGAAAVGRPAHHLIVGADRVHDVEAEQRDVRRLQHVAAGVEHHVGQLGARRLLRRLLAEPDQRVLGKLQPRQHADVLADLAELGDALPCAARPVRCSFRIIASRAIVSRKRGLTP